MRKKLLFFVTLLITGMSVIGQSVIINGIKHTSVNTIDGEPQISTVKDNHPDKGMCDTVFSFSAPTDNPLGIAWDGEYFWHSNANNNNLYKLDTLGNLIDSIMLPDHLGGLEFDGTNLLGVNEQGSSYYKINTYDGTYTDYNLPTFSPWDPNLWGITYGGGNIWVCEYNAGYDTVSRLFMIDPVTNNVLDTVCVKSNILSIQWIGNLIYGINKGAQKVFKINPSNGVLIDSSDWCIPQPFDLTIMNDYLWNVSGAIMYGGNQKVYKLHSDFVIMTSINENENSKEVLLNIFPNPASNTININGFPNNTLAEVFDISGKLLLSQSINIHQIDISSLAKGLYFIKLSTGDNNIVRKFIKE